MRRWAVASVSKAMQWGTAALLAAALVAGQASAHVGAGAQSAEFGRAQPVVDQAGIDAPRRALRAQVEPLGAPETTSPRFAAGPGWLPFWVLLSIAAGGLVAWLLARTGRQPQRPAAHEAASSLAPRLSSPDGTRDAAATVTESPRR